MNSSVPLRRRLRVGFLAAAALVYAAQLAGQQPPSTSDVPAWAGDLAALGGNALFGGLTAGVAQALRGGSFQDGFTRGALGGGVIYVGKRLAVQRFGGAGLLGREVAAVGTSVVRNAAEDRPSLSRLMLPLGPVRLYVEPRGTSPIRARVDLLSLAWTGYAALTPELNWDAGATLSAGAPVFRVRDRLIVSRGDTSEAAGKAVAGVVLLGDIGRVDVEANFAHERVHVLQHDQIFFVWSDPLEEWAVRRLPGGAVLNRYVDLGLSGIFTAALAEIFTDYHTRPTEAEAAFLMRR